MIDALVKVADATSSVVGATVLIESVLGFEVGKADGEFGDVARPSLWLANAQ